MGKKYIVEIGRLERLYKAYVNGNGKPNLTWLSPEVDLTPYTEPDLEQVRKEAYDKRYEDAEEKYNDGYSDGYDAGLDDAWDAARKIADMPYGDGEKIFGVAGWHIIEKCTAAEVIEKLEAYEQEKKGIKVGDEVIPRETEYDTMIVTRLWKDDYDSNCIDAIGFDGRISSFLVSRVSKTGKHYEIAAVLEKMRGEQDG